MHYLIISAMTYSKAYFSSSLQMSGCTLVQQGKMFRIFCSIPGLQEKMVGAFAIYHLYDVLSAKDRMNQRREDRMLVLLTVALYLVLMRIYIE